MEAFETIDNKIMEAAKTLDDKKLMKRRMQGELE